MPDFNEIAELLEHAKHNVEIAWYGDKSDPVSVTLECMDCNQVLIHLRNDARGILEVGAIDDPEYSPEYAVCKRLPSIETDKVQLEVGECECGYHFTADATYLDQVSDYCFECPSCHKLIDTAKVFPE